MNETCKIIAEGQGVARIKPDRLRTALATLVDFRNICAHDDRLYCARTGRRHDRKFSDMLLALEIVTADKEMAQYALAVSGIVRLFDDFQDIQDKVLDAMSVDYVNGIIQPKDGWRRDFTSQIEELQERIAEA